MSMLTISYIIPTYNASFHIERCLKSIRAQHYPQEKIEILILDGGSTDNTLEIVSQYNCLILKNKKLLAEYGVQLGIKNAKGDLLVVFAADNELVSRNWVQKVSNIFDHDKDISAVWGRLVSGEGDSALNKYFELIQSDPLNWFLNKNLIIYKNKGQHYSYECIIFNIKPAKPLVWGANGLVYRSEKIKGIWSQEGYLGDNDAFQSMIERGDNRVAYFNTPFVYHHHVAKLGDWIKKWKRNFIHHLLEQQKTRNLHWIFANNFKVKLLLWMIYSTIPIFSLSHCIYLYFKDRNIYWFYHPVVSFIQFFTYTFLIIFTKKGRDFIRNIVFKNSKQVGVS